MLFGCFGCPFGLIFFWVGRQIMKPINTINDKFVWKVIYIYVRIVDPVESQENMDNGHPGGRR